jgi:hypothetical protein
MIHSHKRATANKKSEIDNHAGVSIRTRVKLGGGGGEEEEEDKTKKREKGLGNGWKGDF